MPLKPQNNRRHHQRALISIAVRKKVGQRVFLCQASNISTGGIFVAHVLEGAPPNPGKCWLEFSLPGSEVLIAARGTVVRQQRHTRYLLSAIRFASIAPSHRRMIQSYIHGPRHLAAAAPSFLPPSTQ
jgi:c-di-GMP-binding flagellar brake protein YcgR